MTVEVLDENDNSPEFPSGAYSYPLAENTPTNTVVIDDVTASDDDSGTNSQIAYSLSGGNGVFSIDISNGHITLVSSLNRETDANYTLNVTATDMGTPESRSAYQLLTVIVVDSNDNPPVFSPPFYTVSIPEVRALTDMQLYHCVFYRILMRASSWFRYLLLTMT